MTAEMTVPPGQIPPPLTRAVTLAVAWLPQVEPERVPVVAGLRWAWEWTMAAAAWPWEGWIPA